MAKYRIVQLSQRCYEVQTRNFGLWWRLHRCGGDIEARHFIDEWTENLRIAKRSPVIAEYDREGREVRDIGW